MNETRLKTTNALINQFCMFHDKNEIYPFVDDYQLRTEILAFGTRSLDYLLENKALEFSSLDSMLECVRASIFEAMVVGLQWFDSYDWNWEAREDGTEGAELTDRERLEKYFQEAQEKHKLRLSEEIEAARKKIAEAQREQELSRAAEEKARVELERLVALQPLA